MFYLEMRRKLLKVLLTALILGVSAEIGRAQNQTIEPCQASPTPKIGSASAPIKVGANVSQITVDATLPVDQSVEDLVKSYSSKVSELNVVIGNLEGELKKLGVGASTIGNFVTDAIMAWTQTRGSRVVLALTNAGGLRKNSIAAGPLKATDVFELLPFENALIEVEVTGVQLQKLLETLTRGRDAQSGARITYRWGADNRPEFISAKLIGPGSTEREIDPAETYTIVTIDYLLKLASGNYLLLQEAKSVTPLKVTIREAVMEYVKGETKAGRPIRAVLDNRFVQIGPDPSTGRSSPND